MNYFDYSVEDFANDPLFVQWVKKPDARQDLFWNEWLDQHPEKRKVVEQARQIVLFLSFTPIQPTEEDMLEVKKGITNFIREQAKEGNAHPVKAEIKIPGNELLQNILVLFGQPLNRVVPMASLAVIVCAAFIFLFLVYEPQVVYSTSFGETKKLELPDGSRVVLNGNSSIRYTNDWKRTHIREVWLTGEGFFEVLKKPEWQQATFTVHTEGLAVEVLGTTFNVNNRRGRVQVMLNSGKVKLFRPSGGGETLDMEPRDFVEVKEEGKQYSKKEVAPERYISWVQHKLVFDETPMREIAQTLEDTYGLQVVFREESLQDLRFTGAVPNHKVDLLLTVLGESLDLDIDRHGQMIILSKE